MERNASQDVDYPLSIERAMAKVLAAVHFPRRYVLNRDERNILGWRENVGFRPSFELDRSPRWSPFPLHYSRPPHGPVFPRKVACRPAVGD